MYKRHKYITDYIILSLWRKSIVSCWKRPTTVNYYEKKSEWKTFTEKHNNEVYNTQWVSISPFVWWWWWCYDALITKGFEFELVSLLTFLSLKKVLCLTLFNGYLYSGNVMVVDLTVTFHNNSSFTQPCFSFDDFSKSQTLWKHTRICIVTWEKFMFFGQPNCCNS